MNDLCTQFKEKGYLEFRGLFSRAEVDELLDAIKNAKQCETGRGRLDDKGLVFNHNLYFYNSRIQAIVSQKKIVDLLTPLAGPDIWIRWDQLVTKLPGGVEFPWHQDNGYNGLKDEHFQFWIALSESNPENGGLWLSPGSHKNGVVPHKWVGQHKVVECNIEQEVPISATRGDAVLFSSMMMHRTKTNKSDVPRLAYVIEYMSTKDYDPKIKAPFFMVAKNGVSMPGFVDTYPGMESFFNHFKYGQTLIQRAAHKIKQIIHPTA